MVVLIFSTFTNYLAFKKFILIKFNLLPCCRTLQVYAVIVLPQYGSNYTYYTLAGKIVFVFQNLVMQNWCNLTYYSFAVFFCYINKNIQLYLVQQLLHFALEREVRDHIITLHIFIST